MLINKEVLIGIFSSISNDIVWSGLGANDLFSNTLNWYGGYKPIQFDIVKFAGISRLSAFNDLPDDLIFTSIIFNPNSGAFVLSGNRFILGERGITNNSPNTQTINNDIKLLSGVNVISSNAGNIVFNGGLSGSGSIIERSSVIKRGSGQANISVARSTFAGGLSVSEGTFQFDNLLSNGGIDTAFVVPPTFNLYGNSTLGFYANPPNLRISCNTKIFTYGSTGSQTISITGNILFNNSTFITTGGLKNYITGDGPNFLNGQFTTITYNVADGLDDVDLEVSAFVHFQYVTKTGAGKMSVVNPSATSIAGPLTINAGTFDVGGSCKFQLNFSNSNNTISNNATLSYSSIVNSNCSNYTISGTGNLVKSGTSSFTLSSSKCLYTGYTAISSGSIITTRDTATATFSFTTLSVNFSTPPCPGNTFVFFNGPTINTYPSITLVNGGGNTSSYSSNNSTLTITGQLGTTITGPQYAQAGRRVDINAAGDVIAFGARSTGNGAAYVYALSSCTWVPIGSTFTGIPGEQLGNEISLNSDGTVVAISSAVTESVRVYTWSGSAWVQRGSTFTPETGETGFGYSVSLNAAGTMIAIGAYTSNGGAGAVRIYSWSGFAWVQLGSTFAGSTSSPVNAYVGTRVVLNSTGNRVLITSHGDTTYRGLTRIYDYSGSSWTQVGNDIVGTVNNQQLGLAASMNSAGNIVALGTEIGGRVKVYSLVSSTWTQVGSDITEAANTYFGCSVSLNAAGNRIAIGEYLYGTSPSAVGRVRIYDFSGSDWSQFGSAINGNAAYDANGIAVALNSDGGRVIIGAPGTVSLQSYGYVRAFQI